MIATILGIIVMIETVIIIVFGVEICEVIKKIDEAEYRRKGFGIENNEGGYDSMAKFLANCINASVAIDEAYEDGVGHVVNPATGEHYIVVTADETNEES